MILLDKELPLNCSVCEYVGADGMCKIAKRDVKMAYFEIFRHASCPFRSVDSIEVPDKKFLRNNEHRAYQEGIKAALDTIRGK